MASLEVSNRVKPIVLHIGDPIKYNPDIYEHFSAEFTVVRPPLSELQRPAFMAALREKRWGNFSAIYRPFWGTGGEMGRWDKELIPLLPKSVKVFASAGAGFDWADVDILAKHGILYCNSASASTEAVADFALFGILSTFRNLRWATTAAHSLSATQWTKCHDTAVYTSHNPRGHTLGIIGLGKIGHEIARKAKAAFGMTILYYDIERKSEAMEKAVGATFYLNLPSMLSISDCVMLATPSTSDGTKLINAATLAYFKDGARFVNIARGSLVDEEALVQALQSGKVSSAMLDVHENEPRVDQRLAEMGNVMLTCHNAGGALETHVGFERLGMENIEAVLNGREAISPVNAHLMKA